MTILYVDDDEEDQDIFREALMKIAPYSNLHQAKTGEEAFKILKEMKILPDYIFLDYNMPLMNAREFLERIKADVAYTTIPVIVYSTSNNQKEIEACLKLGAFQFITKGQTFPQVCQILKNFI